MINYSIMQIDLEKDREHCAFFDRESLVTLGKTTFPPPENLYEKVYSSSQERFDPGELIYIYNMAHPQDYRARSLSTSDIISYELPNEKRLYLFLNGTGVIAVDFGENSIFAKEPQYEPASDKCPGTLSLFYTKKDEIRTVRIKLVDILKKEFVGIDETGEVELTPAEVYEAISAYCKYDDPQFEAEKTPTKFRDLVTALLF